MVSLLNKGKLNLFKIKLPKTNKFKTSKSPIYKIAKGFSGLWDIEKWEVRYDEYSEISGITGLWAFLLIPIFSFSLIPFKYTKHCETFQLYKDTADMAKHFNDEINLGIIWERKYCSTLLLIEEDNKSKTRFKNRIKDINKDFNDNYKK